MPEACEDLTDMLRLLRTELLDIDQHLQALQNSPSAKRIYDAIRIIEKYGGTEECHHKAWIIDQVVRALVDDYDTWVKEMCNGEDGPNTYTWDTGIAP